MNAASTPPVTDAATPDAATPSPFIMVAGDPAAMVCEGDVCYLPGAEADGPIPAR